MLICVCAGTGCLPGITRCRPGTCVLRDAAGEPDANSPLNAPGVNVRPGDKLKAINGRRLSRDVVPQELLDKVEFTIILLEMY